MNNVKLRIISKIGLLFVVIGFFLPISCNLNGFQIAKTAETFGGPNIFSISLYSIFIFSCLGLILLFALLLKNKFSIGYDWFDLIIIIIAFSIFIYSQIQSSNDPLVAIFNRLQSGAYIIFIGLTGSLFFLIAASCQNEKTTNEIEIDEDKLKRIRIMYIIKCILAGVGALFSSPFLFGYCYDFIYKYIHQEDSDYPTLNFIKNLTENTCVMWSSIIIFGIVFIIIQCLLTIIFSIIDKKAVNYWRNKDFWDIHSGDLNLIPKHTKQVNKSEIEIDNEKTEIDEKKKIKILYKPKKLVTVLRFIFISILHLIIAPLLFGLLYNLIPFISGYFFYFYVILFTLLSYAVASIIFLPIGFLLEKAEEVRSAV